MTAHWGVPDPAAFDGPEDAQRSVFFRTYLELHRRIELFTCLPIDALDRLALAARLEAIGKTAAPAGDDE